MRGLQGVRDMQGAVKLPGSESKSNRRFKGQIVSIDLSHNYTFYKHKIEIHCRTNMRYANIIFLDSVSTRAAAERKEERTVSDI